jgi:hypothetical protein
MSRRTADRLRQLGILLIAISIVVGLLIPATVVPELTLATHITMLLSGLMFIAFGSLWTRLQLGPKGERLAFWGLVLGSFGNLTTSLFGAFTGIGGGALSMAAGEHVGTESQEAVFSLAVLAVVLSTSAGIFTVLWGARGLVAPEQEQA